MDSTANVLEGRAFIALLNKIESHIKPASCTYFYFNYWPIIRFAINAQRKIRPTMTYPAVPDLTFDLAKKLYVKAYKKRATQTAALQDIKSLVAGIEIQDDFKSIAPVEALFLTRKSQYHTTKKGQIASLLPDGIRYLANEDCSHLTIVDEDPRGAQNAFLLNTAIAKPPKMNAPTNLRDPKNLAAFWARKRISKTIAQTNALIPDAQAILRVDEYNILTSIMNASKFFLYWIAVLEHLKPKAIFLSSFTGAYYICAAGKHLGIPVIDIQHGGMHSHHPLAANWQHAPEKGYELLPDVFWCWDARSADYVNAVPLKGHTTCVGGNPKAALQYALAHSTLPETTPAQTPDRPQVLVGLQYGSDPMIEPHVKEVYLATRHLVDWRFRLHPMGWSFLDEVVQTFEVPENAVREESNKPLHQVLPEIDLMLCNASTILHEAVDHGAAGAVWSQKGATIFEDLVRQNSVTVATDHETLSGVVHRLLQTDKSARHRPSSEQLQTENIARVRSTFKALMT